MGHLGQDLPSLAPCPPPAGSVGLLHLGLPFSGGGLQLLPVLAITSQPALVRTVREGAREPPGRCGRGRYMQGADGVDGPLREAVKEEKRGWLLCLPGAGVSEQGDLRIPWV
jgi:hypothetical protein